MAEARLDPIGLGRSYPWRGVLDGGGVIAGGSDSPMDSANPFAAMHAAVTRLPFGPMTDADPGAVRMTRLEALRCYTSWAAFALHAEEMTGSLAVGKMADFIIPDTDVSACPARELPDTRVLVTVLGGEVVHGSDALANLYCLQGCS